MTASPSFPDKVAEARRMRLRGGSDYRSWGKTRGGAKTFFLPTSAQSVFKVSSAGHFLSLWHPEQVL